MPPTGHANGRCEGKSVETCTCSSRLLVHAAAAEWSSRTAAAAADWTADVSFRYHGACVRSKPIRLDHVILIALNLLKFNHLGLMPLALRNSTKNIKTH